MSSKAETTPQSEQEKTLAEVGAKKWNDYQKRYVPFEEGFKAQVNTMGDKAGELGAIANADVWQKFAPPAADAPLKQYAAAFDQQGGLAASAVPQAERTALDSKLRSQLKIAAYGRGLADQATVGMYKAGASATQTAISAARSKQEDRDAGLDAAGTLVGSVSRYAVDRFGTKSPWGVS